MGSDRYGRTVLSMIHFSSDLLDEVNEIGHVGNTRNEAGILVGASGISNFISFGASA